MSACPVCSGDSYTPLPTVGTASLASDLRRVASPLRKQVCAACGLVRSADPDAATVPFEHGYRLYAHPPGEARETARQEQYAGWIAAVVGREPRRVLDVGCGNGSLLMALGRRWPSAQLIGCDLSSDSVAYGRAAGLELWASDLAALPASTAADLVVCVNVVEHTPDPLRFLRHMRARLVAGGTMVVICPDGRTPDTELLIADHVSSFTPQHLDVLLARAGLSPRGLHEAPAALGAFQLVVAEQSVAEHGVEVVDVNGAAPFTLDAPLLQRRHRYLERWQALDETLSSRTQGRPLTCFGTGEAAALLYVYAPRTWASVRACTADAGVIGSTGHLGDLPMVALDDLTPDDALLVAVHPRQQEAVATRLRGRFATVVTWDDLAGE